jgi:hypothetical protein
MFYKSITCLTLIILLLAPAWAMGEKPDEQKITVKTKTEIKGKKKIMTRITRLRVGETYKGERLAGKHINVIDFNVKDYRTALKSDKLIILFFYNAESKESQKEFQQLITAFNKLKSRKMIAFRVDYQNKKADEVERAMEKNFGVNKQNTKVFIKNGEKLLQTDKPWNKIQYLSKLSKYVEK